MRLELGAAAHEWRVEVADSIALIYSAPTASVEIEARGVDPTALHDFTVEPAALTDRSVAPAGRTW